MAIETNSDVARRARGIVAERKVKRVRIAEALSISRMALWRRMEGETPFTPEEIIKLASVTGVPVEAFFSEQSVPAVQLEAMAS